MVLSTRAPLHTHFLDVFSSLLPPFRSPFTCYQPMYPALVRCICYCFRVPTLIYSCSHSLVRHSGGPVISWTRYHLGKKLRLHLDRTCMFSLCFRSHWRLSCIVPTLSPRFSRALSAHYNLHLRAPYVWFECTHLLRP